MPRRPRRWREDACYHITCRCHEREFLLKFAKHRNLYLDFLQEAAARFRLTVLDYMATCNHVHLLLRTSRGAQTSSALQYVQGRIAQAYNIAKGREGAFWKDRFHATRIQSGEHLRRCLLYIDMNMVRAGAVDNPLDWKHSGCIEFHPEESLGRRIIDMNALLKSLRMDSMSGFRAWHAKALVKRIEDKSQAMKREDLWSRAIAVGDRDWLGELSAKERLKGAAIASFDGPDGQISFLMEKTIKPELNADF